MIRDEAARKPHENEASTSAIRTYERTLVFTRLRRAVAFIHLG
jgi:hypothetical protein